MKYWLNVRLEDIPWRQAVLVHALVSSIRTRPEPTIFLVLHSLDEELAHLVGGCARVSVFAENNTSKLLLVPVIHGILLLLVFFLGFLITRVGVQILLGGLTFDIGVVGELALPALFTVALLEEKTQNSLWVNAEWNLLDLYRLEELKSLLLGLLCGFLFSLTLLLICGLLFLVCVFVAGSLSIQLLDLSFGRSSLFILETELIQIRLASCSIANSGQSSMYPSGSSVEI